MMDLASPRVGEAAAAGKSSIVIATSRTGGSVAAFAVGAPAETHNAKIVHPKTFLRFMERLLLLTLNSIHRRLPAHLRYFNTPGRCIGSLKNAARANPHKESALALHPNAVRGKLPVDWKSNWRFRCMSSQVRRNAE
jgi:hypothetical protein